MKRTTKTDMKPVLCASCERVMHLRQSHLVTANFCGTCYTFCCTRCGMETPRVNVDQRHPEETAKRAAEYLARQLFLLVIQGSLSFMWPERRSARKGGRK